MKRSAIQISTLLLTLICFGIPRLLRAAEVMPAVPDRYFNDYANVISSPDADQFNQQLAQFERDTSNQILVAIYPKMQTDSDIADYTYRVKETWHVGQKGKNNGAVLFVFIQDHKMFIQVNYGLEGALPDATCKEIIDQEISPRFKAGDFAGGLRAGINAILAATKGEYKGTGHTALDNRNSNESWVFTLIFFAFIVLLIVRNARRSGYRRGYSSGFFWGNSGGSSDDGGFFGGGGGGGNDGFSGGGGTGGGGGADGSW